MSKIRTLAAAMLLLVLTQFDTTSEAIEPVYKGEFKTDYVLPFLGIGTTFGRWRDGVVPIAYNHNDAPDDLSEELMEQRILQAFRILEGVAGVTFDYRGVMDLQLEDDDDEIAVIGWARLTSGGLGGPRWGEQIASERLQLGFLPYKDGNVWLNNHGDGIKGSLSTIIHELMHVLGLGHSENPQTIMNYTVTNYELPAEDDINALQALYGPPDVFVPPVVSMNMVFSNSSFPAVLNTTESGVLYLPEGAENEFGNLIATDRIDDSVGDEAVVWYLMRISNAVVGDVISSYVTDPAGNVAYVEEDEVESSSDWIWVYLGRAENLSVGSGTWSITAGYEGALFSTATFEVDREAPDYNKTPVVDLSVDNLGGGEFELQLAATDEEDDPFTLNWFVPGDYEIEDGPDSLTVNFSAVGLYQVFVELTDQVSRDIAGGAGDGFANLANAYLAVSPEPDVPTFFAEDQILHVPAMEIDGVFYTQKYKLTPLSGITIKLIESREIPAQSNPAATFNSSTAVMSISRLIVVENGVSTQEFSNVSFGMDLTSVPTRFSVQ